jgi:hypothetical protein
MRAQKAASGFDGLAMGHDPRGDDEAVEISASCNAHRTQLSEVRLVDARLKQAASRTTGRTDLVPHLAGLTGDALLPH